MGKILGGYTAQLYAIMRIVVGLLFACHGAQKLLGAFGAQPAGNPLMMTAGVIEFVGGLLVAVGLLAGYAAFLASGQMAVAYFMVHAPQGFWPLQNKGELAVVYCFVFLYVATRGSGSLSLDRVLGLGGKS